MFKNIKIILAGALVGAAALTYTHYSAYNAGKAVSTAECMEKQQEYIQKVGEKITILETGLDSIAKTGEQTQRQLRQDVNKILAVAKQQPVTIIKNGECIPSPEFLDSLNKAISVANQK